MIAGVCKVARHYQIVVPKHIRNIIGLKIGDLINFKLKNDGEITMVPVEVKKKEQHFFFTAKWQKMIKKSENELKKGMYKTYHRSKELSVEKMV
ncbi:MAG: hypothetical protein AUJ85_06975 [Elusimicrobia bacterium CG1_02_37_114]|nr:MAG: hypothetical protein AUJ85_06975 [Elusimicrobia bacterium CG1_02_37_114]